MMIPMMVNRPEKGDFHLLYQCVTERMMKMMKLGPLNIYGNEVYAYVMIMSHITHADTEKVVYTHVNILVSLYARLRDILIARVSSFSSCAYQHIDIASDFWCTGIISAKQFHHAVLGGGSNAGGEHA